MFDKAEGRAYNLSRCAQRTVKLPEATISGQTEICPARPDDQVKQALQVVEGDRVGDPGFAYNPVSGNVSGTMRSYCCSGLTANR